MRKISWFVPFIGGAVFFVAMAGSTTARAGVLETPCGNALGGAALSAHGLTPVNGDTLINDANQGLCWLADANLAGNPAVRALVPLAPTNPDGSTPVINPDGTMDYQTALNWVSALNNYNGGKGWLNHNNWQLPANPAVDTTCSSVNVDNFGVLCTGDAMGNLYNVGLARTYPNSVVPWFFTLVWPFFNLQPAVYWTTDSGAGGQTTFTFNTGLHGENTTKYNYFHVLPMTKALLGPVPPGAGVVPYLSGPGAGKAVYDTNTGVSWPLNANLPAENNFGFTQTVTISSTVDGSNLKVPTVDADGAVYFSAVDPTQPTGWIVSMNDAAYAGTQSWALPSKDDLQNLYNDLGLQAGDPRMEWPFFVGPFWHLQPGFYWGCVRVGKTGNNGACDLSKDAPPNPGDPIPMEWSFNFDDGFLGTDENTKEFYVMVYFLAPPATP
jgi:hypothetical protein